MARRSTQDYVHVANREDVAAKMRELYEKKNGLRDLERETFFYKFGHFELESNFFSGKSIVLLLGQYSVGKTSFIKFLLNGQEYAGASIKDTPSTDKIFVVAHPTTLPSYSDKKPTAGNILTSLDSQQFQSLHGEKAFLDDLMAAGVHDNLLKDVVLIDTPGVLATAGRNMPKTAYDMNDIFTYFIERADLILLFFDPRQINISDEFQRTMSLLRPYRNRLRVVLNKADTVAPQALIETHGSLMWELGRLLDKKEGEKVLIGSFQKTASYRKPYTGGDNVEFQRIFDRDRKTLVDEIKLLGQVSMQNKIEYMQKRFMMAVYNAHLMLLIKKRCIPPNLPGILQRRRLFHESVDKKLEEIFLEVSRLIGGKGVDVSHLPSLQSMRKWLSTDEFDWKRLAAMKTTEADIEQLRADFEVEINKILNLAHRAEQQQQAPPARPATSRTVVMPIEEDEYANAPPFDDD